MEIVRSQDIPDIQKSLIPQRVYNLTQDYLKSIFDYNPETGALVWKYCEAYVDKHGSSGWNQRFAGKPAGSKSKARNCITINLDYVNYKAHHLIWLYVTGTWPTAEIDHKDTNGFNNRWDNLREATSSQQKHNTNIKKTNTSGYKGVSKHSKCNKYVAQITYRYKNIYLGLFSTPEEAYKSYCAAATKYFGEFARF